MSSSQNRGRSRGKGKSTGRRPTQEINPGSGSQPPPLHDEFQLSQHETFQQMLFESYQQQGFQMPHPHQPQYSPMYSSYSPQYQPRQPINPHFQPQVQTQIHTPRRQLTTEDYRDQVEEESDEDASQGSDGPQFAPISDEELEDEETQTRSSKPKPVKWTPNEEFNLCVAAMDISEDPIVGNNQKSKGYWSRVVKRLKEITDRPEVERTVHMCSSKWKDLNGKVNKFSEIYNNLVRSQGPSGTNDSDITELARAEYQKRNNNQVFKYDRIWQFVRRHPKWLAQPPMDEMPPKRVRTSESGDFSSQSSPQTEFEFPEPPRRKGKKPASTSSVNDVSDEATTIFKGYVESEREEKRKFREARIRLAEERQRALDEIKLKQLALLDKKEKRQDREDFIRPHDHLTGYALELVLEQKREIAERWGWNFP